MNESNRRIASLNRIDELNQRVAFQNDPLIASWAAKTVPREPKTPSRRLKSPPRPSKEGPRAPKTIQESPRSLLGTVLRPSWDQPTTRSKTRSLRINGVQGLGVDFGSPNGSQNDPKTTPKRVKNQDEKCITFLSFLDPSWTGLEAILGPSWGQKSCSRLMFSNVF